MGRVGGVKTGHSANKNRLRKKKRKRCKARERSSDELSVLLTAGGYSRRCHTVGESLCGEGRGDLGRLAPAVIRYSGAPLNSFRCAG